MAVAALIIQDDVTPLDDADSYVSAADVILYFDNIGDPAFANEDEDVINACARKATQFFDINWGERAIGSPTDEEQSTVFPRDGKKFPRNLKACICELAKLAVDGPLGGNGATVNAPSAAQIAKMKAGSVEIEFAQGMKSAIDTSAADRFFLVEKLAATFLKSGALNTGSAR